MCLSRIFNNIFVFDGSISATIHNATDWNVYQWNCQVQFVLSLFCKAFQTDHIWHLSKWNILFFRTYRSFVFGVKIVEHSQRSTATTLKQQIKWPDLTRQTNVPESSVIDQRRKVYQIEVIRKMVWDLISSPLTLLQVNSRGIFLTDSMFEKSITFGDRKMKLDMANSPLWLLVAHVTMVRLQFFSQTTLIPKQVIQKNRTTFLKHLFTNCTKRKIVDCQINRLHYVSWDSRRVLRGYESPEKAKHLTCTNNLVG